MNAKTGISEHIEIKQCLRLPITWAHDGPLPLSEIGGVDSMGQGGVCGLPF